MIPTWGCSTFPKPTLDLDFAGATSLDSRITFTRASTATFFNSLGVLSTAASGAARFDYNPTTLAPQGLLIEEQRTNSIRNNTMVGAVAGTPGTVPTNWSVSTTGSGLTREIVGTGTENGITYIDIKVSGTASAATAFIIINEGTVGQISASSGQVWTNSLWVKRVAGNTSGFSIAMQEFDSGANFLRGPATLTTVTTTLTRITQTVTIGASTASIRSGSFISIANGEVVDVTLRIGLPQLEQGAFATSVIPTTTTALTRNADVASMTGTNFSSWYNASEGTLYVEGIPYAPTSSFIRVASIETAGAAGNVISIQRNSTDARGFGDGASTQVVAGMPQNAVFKTAFAGKINDFALTSNGVTPNADTSTNALPTAAGLGIGSTIVGTSVFTGTIRSIRYYPVRLANAQLQALTA